MAWTTPSLAGFLAFVQTGMGINSSVLPPISAPSAPTLTAGSYGSLPSETVYVKLTYVSDAGETSASTQASVTVTGPSGSVTVTSPILVLGATSYNVYAASVSGAEVLQNAAPIAIGTNYTIASLAGGVTPPTSNTAASPWAIFAYNQASDLTLQNVGASGLEYTMAVYNCGGHMLVAMAQDTAGSTYFAGLQKQFELFNPSAGVVQSSSDESTSDTLAVPDAIAQLTIGDLQFFKTPWGRQYLSYSQDFGGIFGLT